MKVHRKKARVQGLHWFLIGWLVVFSFWLRLFAGQGEVLPPGEESSRLFPDKICKWLTGGRQESSPNWLHSSILNEVSFIHFHIIQIMSLMLQFLAKDTNLVCRSYRFPLFYLPKLSIRSSCFCDLRMWSRHRPWLLMHLFINSTEHEAATIPQALF